jgi:FlaA1/EpsC-like NDP-sugar epimerase
MNLFRPGTPATVRRLSGKAAILLVVHALIFAVAFFLAFFTRYDFRFLPEWFAVYTSTVGGVVLLKLVVFYVLGHCHVSWRRAAFSELQNLLWAATLSMLVIATLNGLILSSDRLPDMRPIPRGVILLDWAATILMIGGIRAIWRSSHEELGRFFSRRPVRSVLVVGANQAGELIARNLMATSHSRYWIAGFVDDDPRVQNSRFAGIDVLGGIDRAASEVARRRIDDVVVQSGLLAGKQFRRLLRECTEAGATVTVIPGIDELLGGQQADPRHIQLRPVEIKDLLRREPVKLDDSAVRRLVQGRSVMVTGAGGSIGAEICRQVLRYAPKQLLLVERGENSLFLLEQELARIEPRPPFEPLIADITDEERMDQVMATYKPDLIFHAAAHKHVPMMELNPAEAIKNNCLGTRLLARLADKHGVGKFVAISTDKAVHPTSVMGCSKLLAERYVQAFQKESQTKFVVVRFGNVLGSNGSVVPIFQDQIRHGGPITVTHPEIERFFMMIPEASQLVLQAAAMGAGGEIFVLDMQESVKIVDLARDLITLSGLAEDDIEIQFVGLRPGEKLSEELYFADEQRVATSHEKVFCALHRPAEVAEVESLLNRLRDVIDEPPSVVRARLHELVPEYGPVGTGL